MTLETGMILVILLAAVILFITEKLRVDLIALLVLAALALTGLVTPTEALSGFSSPAVVTVWAVFILSGGLSRTGVADIVGRQVMVLAGKSETRLVIVIMLTAGLMSAVMNNVGVAALLLPVVLVIARQLSISPSRLLMPLAFGCLLGGLTTLIGTPPNILASDALRDFGLTPFQLFDFAPVGLTIMLAGTVFMVFIGRYLLPLRHPVQSLSAQNHETVDTRQYYGLEERLTLVTIPENSPLAGKTLAESRIGRALGLTILGLQRHDRKQMTIQPDTILAGNDQLLALGRLDRLEALNQKPFFVIEEDAFPIERLISPEAGLAELKITTGSDLLGQTIAQINMRRQFGLNVLAIRRGERLFRTNLPAITLESGDILLLYSEHTNLTSTLSNPLFQNELKILVSAAESAVSYKLEERLLIVRVPEDSSLAGQSLASSQLSELFGLVALGIVRNDKPILAPSPDTTLEAEDILLLEGDPENLAILRGLQGLVIKRQLHMAQVNLESESVSMVEAVLSPHTTLVNKTLREVHFREKYGLSILAIWRNGRAYRSNLATMPLQFGDAFLLYGSRERIKLLGQESDFVVLQEGAQEATRQHKAGLAAAIMLTVVISVLVGWLPISIAAVSGSALMVLTGCLNMEEAYHYIDWRAVFLIAGMLPLGIAMQNSGTARLMAEGMVSLLGDFGPLVLMAGFFLLTSVASQFMPNAVVVVLMAPIAITTATDLGISPYALMMAVAISASASFMSPVGHPANILIMGPGGYRFTDYMRVGIPLTVLVLIITLLVLPIFWPI